MTNCNHDWNGILMHISEHEITKVGGRPRIIYKCRKCKKIKQKLMRYGNGRLYIKP